jgi:hypothetical protein
VADSNVPQGQRKFANGIAQHQGWSQIAEEAYEIG